MYVDTAPALQCTGNTFALRADLSDGRVRLAASGGRMLRDPGALLRTGTSSDGVPEFMERAHCLCGSAHALAAVRALEDLSGIAAPPRTELARSLALALRCIRDSLIHIYQFYLSDWIASDHAACADPARTARLADAPGENATYFSQAREALRATATAEAMARNHPARRGSPELHLLIKAHAMQALTVIAELGAALTRLEGKEDGCPFLSVGGRPEGLNFAPQTFETITESLRHCGSFVRKTLLRTWRACPRHTGPGPRSGVAERIYAGATCSTPAATASCSPPPPVGWGRARPSAPTPCVPKTRWN